MGNRWANGDPDEMYGGVALADVVRAIRDLEPGFHTIEEVHHRYLEVTGEEPTRQLRNVSGAVTRFGPGKHTVNYQRGWTIDPAKLAARWPRLPWFADQDTRTDG
jgi:hypothetical protein